jgi:hypothetical protein
LLILVDLFCLKYLSYLVAKVSAQRSAEPLSGFTSVSGSLIEAIHRFVAVEGRH